MPAGFLQCEEAIKRFCCISNCLKFLQGLPLMQHRLFLVIGICHPKTRKGSHTSPWALIFLDKAFATNDYDSSCPLPSCLLLNVWFASQWKSEMSHSTYITIRAKGKSQAIFCMTNLCMSPAVFTD